MDIVGLFQSGTKNLEQKRAEAEVSKQGTLRVGSCGALVKGNVLGTCHRIALARLIGLQEPINKAKRAIFDSGEANEYVWVRALQAEGNYQVWHDAAIPDQFKIRWHTEGNLGTGTPDILLGIDDQPVIGIELKVVESIQSATSLLVEKKPKVDNLLQAAHYSMRLGIPFVLVYTFNGTGDWPYWAIKKYSIPKGSKVQPFKMQFLVEWKEAGLTWTSEDGEAHTLSIQQSNIEDYYKLLLEMKDQKDLYLRYPSMEADGSNMPFDKCAYCSINDACTEYDAKGEYDLWVDRVRQLWQNR